LNKPKKDFPQIEEVMIGSDNASCLASQDSIPFVHDGNALQTNSLQITNWVYTEACTGKNKLDTYFSYVNLQLAGYLTDGNDIKTELDIYMGLCHQKGIAGSSALLFDGTNLCGPVLVNPNTRKAKEFKAKTGVRETHEVQ
jgi:hypothetical protein